MRLTPVYEVSTQEVAVNKKSNSRLLYRIYIMHYLMSEKPSQVELCSLCFSQKVW